MFGQMGAREVRAGQSPHRKCQALLRWADAFPAPVFTLKVHLSASRPEAGSCLARARV